MLIIYYKKAAYASVLDIYKVILTTINAASSEYKPET